MKQQWHMVLLTVALMTPQVSFAESVSRTPETETNLEIATDPEGSETSPVRRVQPQGPRERGTPRLSEPDFRSVDGTGNNQEQPEMGAALVPLTRILPADYEDGASLLSGSSRPSAREVSNSIFGQVELIPNEFESTDFLWQWGQFLDHDLSLTEGVDPAEPADILVPLDDAHFFPGFSMSLNRSVYDLATGADVPRQQLNEITAWIDASNVYGSNQERADALRVFDGSGRLKVSEGNLLPFNELGFSNAGGDDSSLFFAGDVRANEQVGLIAMHTLFVREHNRLADELTDSAEELTGEEIYQRAKSIVAAQMQVVTYREFLPALLGRGAIPRYNGYQPDVDAGIANSFSTAAYRFGHSALSPTLQRLDSTGEEIEFGHLALRDAFFRPDRIITEGGIDPVLRGLAMQTCQSIDHRLIDDVRNFLFGAPPSAGFDLAALNIQRGRDHGLPDYNSARQALGLSTVTSFADITDDESLQLQLEEVYGDINNIDLWVGGLAEGTHRRGQLGELFYTIVATQFTALRDGDRYWYSRSLPAEIRREVEATRLSDIIRRNTEIGDELPDNVFGGIDLHRGQPGNERDRADPFNG